MAGQTPRFGLNFFGGDTPGALNEDDEKFTGEDRLSIDRFFSVTEQHTHRVTTSLIGPTEELDLEYAGDGELDAGIEYFYTISFVNESGLETAAGPESSIVLPDVLPIPDEPQAEAGDGSGTLPDATYYYALTGLRGDEETPLGDPVTITVLPDDDFVTLTLPDLEEAEAYQVWRMSDSNSGYTRVGTSSTGTFVDDGSVPAGAYGDPSNEPPLSNTGTDAYSITITLTGADLAAAAEANSWRIYRSEISGAYTAASLVHEVVERSDDLDPTSALLTSWVDDGDAMLTGSPKLISQEMHFAPFTFDSADPLPDTAPYPENYPILSVDGTLHVNRSGVWTALSGDSATGPTGPTGPTGASGPAGATGPSGAPGGGGGGGSASAPVPYDTMGSTTYPTGSLVYTDEGLYLATVESTGVNPDTYDPGAYPALAGSDTSPNGSAAAHPRISRRFQVNASTEFYGVRVRMLSTYVHDGVSTDHFTISSTDPATSVTPIATGTFYGIYGAGQNNLDNHIELGGLTEGAVFLTADTDYWLIIADPIASAINTVPAAGYNTLSGTMSQTGDTRYSDAVTGTGTTATAATFQFGFDLIGLPVAYWRQLSALRALSLNPNNSNAFAWSNAVTYHLGQVVTHNNALWYSYSTGLNVGHEPTLVDGWWTHVAWLMPTGGTTGQVLAKASDDDGDYAWTTPTP